MEVIEKNEWKQRVVCTGNGNGQSGCGSILEITKSDIRYYKASDHPYSFSSSAAVIKCVVCGCLTDLTKEERPLDWEKMTPFTSQWKNGE